MDGVFLRKRVRLNAHSEVIWMRASPIPLLLPKAPNVGDQMATYWLRAVGEKSKKAPVFSCQ